MQSSTVVSTSVFTARMEAVSEGICSFNDDEAFLRPFSEGGKRLRFRSYPPPHEAAVMASDHPWRPECAHS